MNNKNYIGITAINTIEESEKVACTFNEFGCNMESHHVPMLGCLIHSKTIQNGTFPSKRYITASATNDIFNNLQNRTFNVIHYVTDDFESLDEQVITLLNSIDNQYCHGIQLNLAYPNVTHLQRIRNSFPALKIIFQLWPDVMNKVSSPQELIDFVAGYSSYIDYLLIDPSCGRGKEFNPEESLKVYSALTESFPDLLIGFAGGLSPQNIEVKVGGLVKNIPNKNFSIDIESGVRDTDDNLDMQKVNDYIRISASMLL